MSSQVGSDRDMFDTGSQRDSSVTETGSRVEGVQPAHSIDHQDAVSQLVQRADPQDQIRQMQESLAGIEEEVKKVRAN